ncbi:MAG TPA: helix-turn-helix transcriptional regulator [Polyangiales bacterium]
MTQTTKQIGELLRDWRKRRHQSQLELAEQAEISQRHLSFLESGRSLPSREMLLRLARHLQVPARERNALLLAAGFAPIARERSLDDPALLPARQAVELLLRAYEPFPALAIDRHWQLLSANAGVMRLLHGVDPALLKPPLNVLRVSMHPQGLAPRILNYGAWREHVLSRLETQIEASRDAGLIALLGELKEYPIPDTSDGGERAPMALAGVAVPLQLASERGVLSFLSTTTVFGTPVDITLAELAIEAFLPADQATAAALGAAN